MSSITSKDIDEFKAHLKTKPLLKQSSFQIDPDKIQTQSSSTVKKNMDILMSCLKKGAIWGYIKEAPKAEIPNPKYKKREYWTSTQVRVALDDMENDKLLHLAVHMAFVFSTRAGETVGIDIESIDFSTNPASLMIKQQVQRVEDEDLVHTPKDKIICIFPKHVTAAKTSLVLKNLKWDGEARKVFILQPLAEEIKARMNDIERNKDFFGSEYQGYKLLLCKPDGRPIDPKDIGPLFKSWQASIGIAKDERIDFQGLRKSGEMYKIRLDAREYKTVAIMGGHSEAVLRKHYDKDTDADFIKIAKLIEEDFYPQIQMEEVTKEKILDTEATLQAIKNNPEFAQQVMQLLISNAVKVAQ